MVADLVRRCRLVMAGEPLPQADPVAAEYVATAREVSVELRPDEGGRGYRVDMIAPHRRGLLSKAAGVLALNSLRVHAATVNIAHETVITEFVVSPYFGSPPAAQLICEQFGLALADGIDVVAALQRRQAESHRIASDDVPVGVPASDPTAPPRIGWFDSTPGRSIVEVRAVDRPGLLARLAAALEGRESTSCGRKPPPGDRRSTTFSVWSCRIRLIGRWPRNIYAPRWSNSYALLLFTRELRVRLNCAPINFRIYISGC